ncbi:MAG: ATP-binding protein [Pseudomonadota bacterium]
MVQTLLYPRSVRSRLEAALDDTPVVLIHGPRQCGKTTLATMLGDDAGYAYVTFDDDVLLAAAQADPVGFVADLPEKTILDEIQRVPALFLALKSAVDRDRRPGRFILTGSTNVLLLPKLADSLAGRIEILRLHPLGQDEILGKASHFLEKLFSAEFRNHRFDRLGHELADRIVAGGYPAALFRSALKRRVQWYRDYIETLVQRDVRDLARISALSALPRLLQLAAGQTARLVNVAEMASAFQLSRPTVRDYVVLLERIFLLEHLPPWHSNRLSRLIKKPKLHMSDTGIATTLLGVGSDAMIKDRALFGQLLETFVFQELRRQGSRYDEPVMFHHFRNRDGVEVDVVLEQAGKLAGIEINASATVTMKDFRGLNKLKESAGERFAAGAVVYDGENLVGFGDRLYAVPVRAIWETT